MIAPSLRVRGSPARMVCRREGELAVAPDGGRCTSSWGGQVSSSASKSFCFLLRVQMFSEDNSMSEVDCLDMHRLAMLHPWSMSQCLPGKMFIQEHLTQSYSWWQILWIKVHNLSWFWTLQCLGIPGIMAPSVIIMSMLSLSGWFQQLHLKLYRAVPMRNIILVWRRQEVLFKAVLEDIENGAKGEGRLCPYFCWLRTGSEAHGQKAIGIQLVFWHLKAIKLWGASWANDICSQASKEGVVSRKPCLWQLPSQTIYEHMRVPRNNAGLKEGRS